jgi:hypothetical protein
MPQQIPPADSGSPSSSCLTTLTELIEYSLQSGIKNKRLCSFRETKTKNRMGEEINSWIAVVADQLRQVVTDDEFDAIRKSYACKL